MRLPELTGLAILPPSFPLPLDRPFSAREAQAEGFQPRQLGRLIEHGFLRRPVRGVYLATALGDSTALRCEVLKLVVPADHVVCDRHAGWLHGAEMALAPGEHLELRRISVFRPSGKGRLRNGLTDSGERMLSREDVVEIDGLRVTTPLRTAWDLGRVRFTEPSIAGMDTMLRLGVFDRAELLAGVERFRGMRWVTTLRAIAPLADGRSESPPESVLRLRWIESGLPAPEPQYEVFRDGQLLGRLDLGHPGLRLAAEYDGVEWHASPEQQEHDWQRRTAIAKTGWQIEIFVSDDIWGHKANADQRFRAAGVQARCALGARVNAD